MTLNKNIGYLILKNDIAFHGHFIDSYEMKGHKVYHFIDDNGQNQYLSEEYLMAAMIVFD